uniref:J domain-containing protein n=1 Tax=Oryza barthii TaxID=65489 RepID=A0A0D3G7C3_9ORYZ
MAAPVASASASCFAPRSDHGGGWSYGGTRGVPSPRRGAARRLRRILGLDASASYTAAQLKAAFRARVKEFHPDVCKDTENADLIMRRVLEAYEILSDMFWQLDLRKTTIASFAGCPYSCVKRAPHAFAFADDTGTAHASSQGHYDDYNVQLAVGQCPRKCMYYVTPCQRTILEEILASVLMTPYDLSEAAVLDSLLSKAMFENNRYKKPKRETKSSSDYVDWM